MSTAGGIPCKTVDLHYPDFGDWRADVVLVDGDPPAVGSPIALVVGDLALPGFVLRSDDDAPALPHVIIIGAPGWELEVSPAPSYQSDLGVRLSTVLKDLAKRANQPIELPPERLMGTSFAAIATRPGEPVLIRDVLALLVQKGFMPPWRVDPDGVTRFGPRPGIPIAARATVIRANAGVGARMVGIDSPAAFLPGNMLGGTRISKLVVTEKSKHLTATLYSATPSMTTSFLRKVAEWFPQLFYGYPRTYVVTAVRADKSLDSIPLPEAPYLPELNAVEQWNLGGGIVEPAIGAEVVVSFIDANPTRAKVMNFAPGTPTKLHLDASSLVKVGENSASVELASGSDVIPAPGAEVGRVVRYGDAIMFPSGPGATPTALPILGSAPGAIGAPVAPFPASKVTA